jgi:Lon protease-like protein
MEDLLLLNEDERVFGITSVRAGRSPEVQGLDALYPVGVEVVVRSMERLGDGRFDITTVGRRRFHIDGVDTSMPLIRADVTFLNEDSLSERAQVLAREVAEAFAVYRTTLAAHVGQGEEGSQDIPDDPTVLSFLVTAALVVPPDERNALLSAPTTDERLVLAHALLARETTFLRTFGAVPSVDLGDAGSVN